MDTAMGSFECQTVICPHLQMHVLSRFNRTSFFSNLFSVLFISVLFEGRRLSRVSTSALLAGNDCFPAAFYSHENSRRTLQHGPAGCCRVVQRGHRRRRYAIGVRSEERRVGNEFYGGVLL